MLFFASQVVRSRYAQVVPPNRLRNCLAVLYILILPGCRAWLPTFVVQHDAYVCILTQGEYRHPDRGGDKEKFSLLQKAFETLSDPESRAVYNAKGEKGIQKMADGASGGGSKPKGRSSMVRVRLTLEEMFNGKTVTVPVDSDTFEPDRRGSVMTPDGRRFRKVVTRKRLEVHVPQGARNGQRITFDGEGDKMPGMDAGDVVVVLQQQKHSVFERKGADLILQKEISLCEALTGVDFTFTHLDGSRVRVRSQAGEILGPKSVKEVPGEGMPVLGHERYMRGALFVAFEVDFPESLTLTVAQRRALISVLRGKDAFKEGDDAAAAGGGARPAPGAEAVAGAAAAAEKPAAFKELIDVDLEGRKAREELSKETYDSDEEQGGGGVQCAQA